MVLRGRSKRVRRQGAQFVGRGLGPRQLAVGDSKFSGSCPTKEEDRTGECSPFRALSRGSSDHRRSADSRKSSERDACGRHRATPDRLRCRIPGTGNASGRASGNTGCRSAPSGAGSGRHALLRLSRAVQSHISFRYSPPRHQTKSGTTGEGYGALLLLLLACAPLSAVIRRPRVTAPGFSERRSRRPRCLPFPATRSR